MRLHIIAAALPPQFDGIGDYTARLASELTGRGDLETVTLLTARDYTPSIIPGVCIKQAFSVAQPRTSRFLVDALVADRPDWVLLQYNPFSYGRRGWNPYLPLAMRSLRRRAPGVRIALMAHETFVPPLNAKFAVMRVYQKAQFRALGRAADAVFLSIEPWAQRFTTWFPGKPVQHLPVGSNIPHVGMTRDEARARLDLPAEARVLGLFGTMHISRLLSFVQGAATAAREAGHDARVLYMGPHSAGVRAGMSSIPLIAEGPLPAEEISRRFAAVDVCLAPFVDGVSTRRTTLMTAFQHSAATVGTRGEHTDDLLERENERAILLSDVRDVAGFNHQVLRLLADEDLRSATGREGRALYEREFSWKRIADRLLSTLNRVSENA